MVQGPFDGWNKPENPDRRRFRLLFLILLLVGGGIFAATRFLGKDKAPAAGGGGSAGPAAAPVAKTEWTTDEIASDPEGYLKWADDNIDGQIRQRREMLASISERRSQVESRQKVVADQLAELKRLHSLVKEAEAANRWPVRVDSRVIEKEKGVALLAQIPKQVELRLPLARDYDEALSAMAGRQSQLEEDIASLEILKQRIALDVERVRLSRDVDELAKLSRSSQEISSFTGLVGSSPAEAPPAVGGTAGIQDLDALLK